MNRNIKDILVLGIVSIVMFTIGLEASNYPHQDVTQSDYKNPYVDNEKLNNWITYFNTKIIPCPSVCVFWNETNYINPNHFNVTYFFCGKETCFFADEYGMTKYTLNRSQVR